MRIQFTKQSGKYDRMKCIRIDGTATSCTMPRQGILLHDIDRFRDLRVPVLLQTGTESPRRLYITDTIAAVLPDVCIEELPNQAHEGMTTAPNLYAEAVSRFLLS